MASTLRPLLLSIAAAELMDPTAIAAGLHREDEVDDNEDEEKYLDSGNDSSDKLAAQLKQWIGTSVKIADGYCAASDKLLAKSMHMAGVEGDEGSAYCEKFLDVVIGACAGHTHDTLAWGGSIGHRQDDTDLERFVLIVP